MSALFRRSGECVPGACRGYASTAGKRALHPRVRRAAALALGAGGASLFIFSRLYQEQQRPALGPGTFADVRVRDREQLTADACRLVLGVSGEVRLEEEGDVAKSGRSVDTPGTPRHITLHSVYLVQPEIQIERAYTPLQHLSLPRERSAELLIKRYSDGEVSRYLNRLRPGDTVRCRGPVPTVRIDLDAYDDVVFVCGGTGVTPFLQFTDALQRQAGPEPRISLLYGSRSESDIYYRENLEEWAAASPTHSLKLFVDAPRSSYFARSPLHHRRIGENDLKGVIDPTRKQLLLVSGPPPMLRALAGLRGPIQGHLGTLKHENLTIIRM